MVLRIQTEHQLLGQMIKSYPDYALYEFHLRAFTISSLVINSNFSNGCFIDKIGIPDEYTDYLIFLIFVPIYLFVRKSLTLLVIISL